MLETFGTLASCPGSWHLTDLFSRNERPNLGSVYFQSNNRRLYPENNRGNAAGTPESQGQHIDLQLVVFGTNTRRGSRAMPLCFKVMRGASKMHGAWVISEHTGLSN